MLRSFGNDETRCIWDGIFSRKLPQSIQGIARRKLRMLNNAVNTGDLMVPPGNHLETLKGSLTGFQSIRINDQWRIIFRWSDGDCYDVEIKDYH